MGVLSPLSESGVRQGQGRAGESLALVKWLRKAENPVSVVQVFASGVMMYSSRASGSFAGGASWDRREHMPQGRGVLWSSRRTTRSWLSGMVYIFDLEQAIEVVGACARYVAH